MCQWSSSWFVNLSAVTFIPNNQYAWIYFGVDILELCFTFTSATYVGLGLYVFSRCPIFGRNLNLVVFTMIMNFYGMLVLRVVVIFVLMANGKSASSLTHFFSCTSELRLFEYGRIGFIGSYFTALGSLSVERVIATIQLATYEKENQFKYFLLSIVSQMLSFFFAFTINIYNMIPFEYIVLMSVFMNLIIFVTFIFAERINFHWYKNAQSSSIGLYTLGERFQLSENVRTSRILKETLTLCFTLNIVCQVTIFFDTLSTNILVRQVAVAVFNLTIVFYGVMFVAIPMIKVPSYRRKTIELLQPLRCQNSVGPIDTKRPVLIDLAGNPMSFKLKEETNVYFESLKKQWE